jgi:hypothetical protein
MGKRLLSLSLVICLGFAVVPNAFGDASIVQDKCEITVDGKFLRVEFTLVNFAVDGGGYGICDLHFIPEPLPVISGCEMIDCTAPAGWSCFLSPLGGADWFANTPADCVPAGTHKSGFKFELDPEYCCYIVQFTDATGAVAYETEECFCSQPVPTVISTWGLIKAMYD